MPSRTDDAAPTRPHVTGEPAADRALQAEDEYPLTRESFRAVLSSHQRAGSWEAADEIEAVAICGEVTLDFRRAELPPSGAVEIHARAICGEVKIIVPDGAEIELEGEPVLGNIEHQVLRKGMGEWIREMVTGERDEDGAPRPAGEEPPFFRIEGRAILGSVKVMGR